MTKEAFKETISEATNLRVNKGNVIDALRIECSMLTPSENEAVRFAAQSATRALVEDYGQFMSVEKLSLIDGIEDRILVLRSHTYKNFIKEWQGPFLRFIGFTEEGVKWELRGYAASWGLANLLGQLSLVKDPYYRWKKSPEWVKTGYHELFDGDTSRGANFGMGMAYLETISEEVLHQLQDHSQPTLYKESGIKYYCMHALNKLGFSIPPEDEDFKLLCLYNELIIEYGDDVHRLAFGGTISETVKKEINKKASMLARQRIVY